MSKVVLLFKADDVGPVCQRLSKAAVESGLAAFEIAQVSPSLSHVNMPNNVVIQWGSRQPQITAKLKINSTAGISLARDKKDSRQALGALSPKTFYALGDAVFPCVVRPRRHHAGHKFYVANNALQLKAKAKLCGLGWYGSELIKKESEFRVFVLHGRVVAVSQRFPAQADAVAWNMALGGKLINCKYKSWPVEVLKAAIEATKILGLDFSAMDIAVEKDTNRIVVFEANTAPGLRNPFTLSCLAKAFAWNLDHELPKPVVASASKWNQFVHPSLKTNL